MSAGISKHKGDEDLLKLRNALSAIISDARMTIPYGPAEPWERVHIDRFINKVETAMVENTKELAEIEKMEED